MGTATDTQGLVAESAAVELVVVDELGPAVSVTSPATGARSSRAAASRSRVRAEDGSGVASLRLAASALGFDETRAVAPAASPATATFVVAIPADAAPGSVSLVASARDALGNTGTQAHTLRVADRRAPAASLATPGGSLAIEPGSEAAVDVQAADETGVVRIEFAVTGQAPQIRSFAATPATTERFLFPVPADLPRGASLVVQATAFDAAGNAGSATPLVLTAPELRAPQLIELLPPDGASQGASPVISARFDAAIARASATAERFFLRDGAGAWSRRRSASQTAIAS